ncbi:MAG: sugar phosphate isomerase/epimerase family protein [Sphaerochaeta sp.]
MKFAGRINSFLFQSETNKTVIDSIERYKEVEGITHLEFNYPEHVTMDTVAELRKHFGHLKVNGVATRFRNDFIHGEFTNADEEIRQKAIKLCKEAIDVCRELEGDTVTIWQAFDGFDYPFQMDYEVGWNKMIEAFREVADYGSDLKISIEYKPLEPRAYAALDSIGTTLLAIKEIDKKNVGATLDFCHMIMKHDSPAYALALTAHQSSLFGLHMNDGDGRMDNGLIFGTLNTSQAFEFVYYLKKYNYTGVVFFDTFPVREEVGLEIQANIEMFVAISKAIDKVGMERIGSIVSKQDGIQSQKLIRELISNI